jgi:hypothetical protein
MRSGGLPLHPANVRQWGLHSDFDSLADGGLGQPTRLALRWELTHSLCSVAKRLSIMALSQPFILPKELQPPLC